MAEAVALMTKLTGAAPLGWYTGRDSPQTRRLVVEHGGFLYDSDSYADDLPYWTRVDGTDHLVVPYTLDTNDMRFARPADSAAATSSSPICATHSTCSTPRASRARRRCCRSGCTAGWSAARPASPRSSASSITCSPRRVWIARRVDIARHWIAHFPPG